MNYFIFFLGTFGSAISAFCFSFHGTAKIPLRKTAGKQTSAWRKWWVATTSTCICLVTHPLIMLFCIYAHMDCIASQPREDHNKKQLFYPLQSKATPSRHIKLHLNLGIKLSCWLYKNFWITLLMSRYFLIIYFPVPSSLI